MVGVRRSVLVVAAASVAWLVAGSSALAQGRGGGGGFGGGRMGGMFGGGDMFAPSIDSRELDRYEQILGLSRDQRDLVRDLFDGYQQEFRAAATGIREKMEAAREQARAQREAGGERAGGGQGGAAFSEIRDTMTQFRTQRDKMEQGFFADVQAVLTPEQTALWPKVERTRRRERTMQRGLMSGERMDVMRLVDEASVTGETRATIAPLLEQYEMDLDRALVERNKVYDDGLGEAMANFRGPEDAQNPEALARAQRLMTAARDASVRVRDTNRRYARQVMEALPAEQRPAFERAIKQASFPGVYRATRTSRELTAAAGFADVDATQRQAITELTTSYNRQLEVLNDQLATATEQNEMSMTVERLVRRFGRGGGGGGDDDPAADLREKRRELDRTTTDGLRKLLTTEQVERLPQAEEDEAPGRRGAPGDGERRDRPRRDGR